MSFKLINFSSGKFKDQISDYLLCKITLISTPFLSSSQNPSGWFFKEIDVMRVGTFGKKSHHKKMFKYVKNIEF